MPVVENLRVGNIVRVYQNPFTREDEETGVARLVRRVSVDDATGWEDWMVDFNDGHGLVRRTLHPSDKIAD